MVLLCVIGSFWPLYLCFMFHHWQEIQLMKTAIEAENMQFRDKHYQHDPWEGLYPLIYQLKESSWRNQLVTKPRFWLLRAKGDPSCGCKTRYDTSHPPWKNCYVLGDNRFHPCVPESNYGAGWFRQYGEEAKRFLEDWEVYYVDLDLDRGIRHQLGEYE